MPGCQDTVNRYADKGVSLSPFLSRSRVSFRRLKRLVGAQVGVMFNYSAEAPLGSSKPSSGIDQNCMREIHSAVIEAAKLTPTAPSVAADPTAQSQVKPSLLAIKLTGLIFDASLLTRASNALTSSSTFARGANFSPTDNDNSDGESLNAPSFVFPQSPELSEEDHAQLSALYEGLRKVAGEARTQGVRLLVDAEQSWYQPARLVPALPTKTRISRD